MSRSLYRGGEIGIFPESQGLGRSSEFFQVPEPIMYRRRDRNFQVPVEAYRGVRPNSSVPVEAYRGARNSSKSQNLGRSLEFFQVPRTFFRKAIFPNVASSEGRGGVGSQYPGLGVPQRKDLKHVKLEKINIGKCHQ